MTEAPAIQSFFLNGPAGRLEAILNRGSADAQYAAVVCHPHPMFGGTMHNKVVFHAMKALNHFGFPVLRFNFRGAGLSEGVHAEGDGERDDVRAALDWLAKEYRLPIIFAGFSFGAAVGMRVACPDERREGDHRVWAHPCRLITVRMGMSSWQSVRNRSCSVAGITTSLPRWML